MMRPRSDPIISRDQHRETTRVRVTEGDRERVGASAGSRPSTPSNARIMCATCSFSAPPNPDDSELDGARRVFEHGHLPRHRAERGAARVPQLRALSTLRLRKTRSTAISSGWKRSISACTPSKMQRRRSASAPASGDDAVRWRPASASRGALDHAIPGATRARIEPEDAHARLPHEPHRHRSHGPRLRDGRCGSGGVGRRIKRAPGPRPGSRHSSRRFARRPGHRVYRGAAPSIQHPPLKRACRWTRAA